MIPDEAIRTKAYFLWEARQFWNITKHQNGKPYTAQDDWEDAKRILQAQAERKGYGD